eukprot:TRINITY_DN5311_c0_g1_i2.p1 TRINITY_DN5311_c0_g1~~TRINITY_DN5311_c0_g1_i2.p1  ORF type:complete len:149 (+),score=26.76 TRINITY_DN5311_c0_g1_i2:43-489(+)
MLGLGGYGSDSDESSHGEDIKRAKLDVETADDEMKRELDFSTWGCEALYPEVSPVVEVDQNAASLIQALRDENKNPTEFIRQHHDFLNPERTNSIIESLRSQEGVPIRVHQSHIPHRNNRLMELSDATHLLNAIAAKRNMRLRATEPK